MLSFAQGDILDIAIPDPTGRNTKTRPVMVYTADLQNATQVIVIAITGSIDTPRPSHHLPLPWARQRHAVTGLFKPCDLKCDWWRVVSMSDAIKATRRGRVPTPILRQAIQHVTRLQQNAARTESPQ